MTLKALTSDKQSFFYEGLVMMVKGLSHCSQGLSFIDFIFLIQQYVNKEDSIPEGWITEID